MKRIRIGKDIAIRWNITLPEGTTETLKDMDLSVVMKDPRGNKVGLTEYKVNDYNLEIGLAGKSFAYLGAYTLTLWKNRGEIGQSVVDAVNAFELVGSTDKECDCSSAGNGVLDISTFDLYSDLEFLVSTGGGGGSVTVVNNLNSTSTTSALSANQGRVLDNKKIDKGGLKTINGQSLEGSGDIEISGGGGSTIVVDALDSTSSTSALSANQGRVLKGLVDNKINTGGLKTINGQSLEGSGDITISGGGGSTPTVGNGKVRILQDGVEVGSFNLNDTENTDINIESEDEYVTKYERFSATSTPKSIPEYITSQSVELHWITNPTAVPSFTNFFDVSNTIPRTQSTLNYFTIFNSTSTTVQSGTPTVGHSYFFGVKFGSYDSSTLVALNFTAPDENGWLYYYLPNWQAGTTYLRYSGTLEKLYCIDVTELNAQGAITLPSDNSAAQSYCINLFKELDLVPGQNYAGSSGDPILHVNSTTILYPETTATVEAGDSVYCENGGCEFTMSYRVPKSESDTNINTLTLNNVDRLLLIGDSYTESMYYIKGKAWVCQYNEMVDYNVEAYGWGGHTAADIKGRLDNDETRYNEIRPSKLGATRCIIMDRANDGNNQTANTNYGTNMDALLTKCESMGMKPIIAGEFRDTKKGISYHAQHQVAKMHNTEFWNITDVGEWLCPNHEDSRQFKATHPGNRCGGTILNPMLAFTKARLPRPESSIKIYRKRGTSTDISTPWNKLVNFKEIGISHSSLLNSSEWDTLNTVSNGNIAIGQSSEYGLLMHGNRLTTETGDYLVQIILPTNKQNCTSLFVDIESSVSYSAWNGTSWVQCTISEDLSEYLIDDKLSILVQGTYIEAPTVRWTGQYVAKSFNPSDVYRAGSELLQECKASELCDSQYKVAITDHGYPYGPSSITHVANIGNTGFIEVDIPSVNKTPGTLLDNTLRIVARWNPANDSTLVTETSLDRKLITLKAKSALNSIDDIWGFTGSFDVDMSWTLIEIPLSGNFRAIRIYGEDPNIEIAYVSVLSR